jgi:signal transduction histidine kinase
LIDRPPDVCTDRRGLLDGEERERLAREIHDTLSQGFTSIVMHLEAAEQAMPEDLKTLRHHLDRARDTARDNLTQARQVVHDLRPDLLAQHSLPEALDRVVARWSEESGIVAVTKTTGAVLSLPAEVDVTLLRATQEALANVRKHAQAQVVNVTLSYVGDVIVLDVQDDGVGFDGAVPSPLNSGFGLTAMRERVTQLGGTVVIESEPGQGTILMVEIPIIRDED